MPLFTVDRLRESAREHFRRKLRLFADEETEQEEEPLEPLDEEPGEVYTVLEIGDKVETPDGPGEVVNIALHGADYGDHHELEPPAISVKLEDGTETTVCPCVIELEDEELTQLLHDEYNRLWPPMEKLPGDAQRLVDDEKLEYKNRESLSKRFMRAYLRANKYANSIVTAEGPLAPGMVLEELEGVDVGDKGAVVVDVEVHGDKQTVKLYFPDTDSTKTVKLSVDSAHRALEHVEPKQFQDSVYDSEVLDEGEIEGLIRWVPDSYIPKNPNYPSTLSDALWRPTYRQYPQYPGLTWASAGEENDMRRRRADYGSPYDYEDAERDDPYYTEDDWVDYPQITEQDVVEEDWDPDLQPSPERLYENPIALFDPDKSPKKLFDEATTLWQEYQMYRHRKIPGVTWDHGNMPFSAYCYIYMQEHDMPISEMEKLWDYMEEIGFMTMRERRQWEESVDWARLDVYDYKVLPNIERP